MASIVSGQANDDLDWVKFVWLATTDVVDPKLENSELKRVWANFNANIDRIKAMIGAFMFSSWFRSQLQLSLDVARFRTLGTLDLDEDWGKKDEIKELIEPLLRESLSVYISKIEARKTGDADKDKRLDLDFMSGLFERESKILGPTLQNVPQMRVGLEHFIETSIAAAWTAFEVMAEDLWEAAINVHPDVLASLSAKPAIPTN